MTAEGGKPLIENRDEIEWCAACFDYYAEIGRDSAGRVIPPIEATQLAMVVKDPLGVVGCIVPWNYPLLLLCWKVAPALAAGCPVVCKPSEVTPLSTLQLAGCFDHLPAGVVNLIAGAGDVGAALCADERVDCIAFTGSVATGKRVAMACAERLARVNLEMGGKDPFIVCADMAGAESIEIAARGGAWAAYLNAGQVCTSAERFYVAREVYDDYVSAFVDHTESLVLGDPTEVGTDIGPMVSAPQRAEGRRPGRGRGRGRSRGADRRRLRRPGAGALLRADRRHRRCPPRPTCCARRRSARSRRSSPSATSTRRSSWPTAPASASARTSTPRDLKSAVRCMRELRAGTVWINDPLTDNDAGPFGGFKQSGIGRELGREGLEAFQETKHVHMETEVERKEWWYPYREYGAG